MGRTTGLLGLLLLAPVGLAGQEAADDGRTLHWREMVVSARLDADGRLHVRERQAMVFDGAWNGGERVFDLRWGQDLALNGVARLDPVTGARTPLVSGDLDRVDRFDWTGSETLRWRSRLESDPPFRNREIVYELDYVIWPVLVPGDDGEYRLRHDFAFPDRDGVIERFEVELTFDPAWAAPAGARLVEAAERLPPGRGYTLDVPLRYVGAGEPAAVPVGAPAWARTLAVAGALLVPLLVLTGLRRRAADLDLVAPVTPPEAIDDTWLRDHIFGYQAEIVGAAWDRSVGEAEVAALLARLVEEGKLTSRIEEKAGEPVLHLRRVAPLDDLPEHERDLLEGLFFDGGDSTDTASIRKHYKEKGFDPASRIRDAVTARLEALPGRGGLRRAWLAPAGIVIAGGALTVSGAVRSGEPAPAVLGLVIAAIVAIFSLAFSTALSRRVTHRAGPAVGVVLPLVIAGLLLALLGSGDLGGPVGLPFYRPGAPLLLGLLLVLGGIGLMAITLSAPTESPERLAFRRRLVSAREFFEAELASASPRLQDAWFPYLLAFGLGPHIDRWFRSFGGREAAGSVAPAVVASAGPGGRSGSGWSGGGPQFGGGSWGGGGAGGTWGVAAAGMAAGVSPPSSSGGGGGGSSSGGGGGGGW